MHARHEELDPAQQGLTEQDHAVLRALITEQSSAYIEEIRALRQRVAVLEAELAKTRTATISEPASEFSEPVAPAVAATPVQTSESDDEAGEDPTFARAWTSDDADASFEERWAEKAFFQAETVDEQSRNWLLEN